MSGLGTIARTATLGMTTGEIVEWMVIAIIFYLIVYWISTALPTKVDRAWLPAMVMWGFAAKLVGTLLRYYMAVDLYGTGDAFRYHSRGVAFAGIWRTLAIPVSDAGGQGTAFTEVVTGLVYSIYTPTMRGGFLMFAFLAFLGQLMFYAALRPWLKTKALKRYAIAVLFFPSLVFWPASIGKDALMMLFLGLATLGISRLLRRFEPMGLITAGLGLYLAAQVRPHVAIMLALAGALAFLLMRRTDRRVGGFRRIVLLVLAVVGLTFAWGAFSTDFGVSLEGSGDTADPGAFLESVQNQTAQGGSEVSGGIVSNPLDLPAATLKVLFRPLIYEASNLATAVSAVEGTVLLFFIVWKIPMMFRNRRMVRGNPLLLLSFFYTGGFIIAFSSILNLGILARQRVQVLPFLLALLVTLAWPAEDEDTATTGHHRTRTRNGDRLQISASSR
ncbi:MAG: hypothetical protein WCE80_05675 [Acidimicrobiia bacterium]